MQIIKRDGSTEEFNKERIYNAIMKAMKYGSGIVEEKIAEEIATLCELAVSEGRVANTIYAIEEYIFEELIALDQDSTARAYESYKSIQTYKRNNNSSDESILGLINTSNEEVMKENSNKNAFVISTQRDLIAGEVSKDIVKRKMLPEWLVQAHNECLLHWHDMDYSLQKATNCCLVNLEDMLDNGTVINDKLVESPKSFGTACTITTQIMAQVASNQYGGQSITIKHLAKYLKVTEDKFYKYFLEKYNNEELARNLVNDIKMKDLRDGVQTIRYQLSTLQTTNGQSPFGTIYLEIEEGHPYEKEMALICEEMLNQRIEGMKNKYGQEIGEAFPKLVYVLDEHNCLEGGKYDYLTKLAVKCSAKRLVPDYQSAKIMRQNYEGCNFPPIKIVA